jgi:hypothetical protein
MYRKFKFWDLIIALKAINCSDKSNTVTYTKSIYAES